MQFNRVISAAASAILIGILPPLVAHTVAAEPATAPAGPQPIKTPKDFADRVTALSTTIATLPANEAASQWLSLATTQPLVQRWSMMNDGKDAELVRPQQLMKALPTPAQWPALRKMIDQRAAAEPKNEAIQKLLLLVATLQNDTPAAQAALKQLKALLPPQFSAGGYDPYQNLSSELTAAATGPDDLVSAFEQALKTDEQQQKIFSDESYVPSVDVPDLVTLVGKDKAADLLKKALLIRVQLEIPVGDDTRALARQLAKDMVKQLAAPQWRLCCTVNDPELYEAMVERAKVLASPQRGSLIDRLVNNRQAQQQIQRFDSYERRQATGYYLLGLIIKGRTDDAIQLAKTPDHDGNSPELSNEGINALESSGHGQQLYDFLVRLAQVDPSTPYWNTLIEVAAHIGQAPAVLQMVQQAYARNDLTPQQHNVVASRLAAALLAADQVEDGIARLRETVKTGNSSETFRMAVQMATIGRIVKKPDWVKDGLDAALTIYNSNEPINADYEVWTREMTHADRLAELVTAITDRMVRAEKDQDKNSYRYSYSDDEQSSTVAAIYAQLGRSKDVLDWLDKNPKWDSADLASIRISGGVHAGPPPLAYWAAKALVDQGRIKEARPILDYVLLRRGGFDPAYELLLQIEPNPIPVLDSIFARDQFEERPLIWKAVLLRQAKKLDEAETLLRQAIRIDPSDGEEGKGDRMRVYAVLAEVLAEKGDAKQEEFFRNVVASIRASEDADDAYYAGLLSRAIGMYTDALKLFSDAYCIQSRLAIQLAKLGRMQEAEAHYQRAYELMPDSFGRVESHCFGCERAFAGAVAEGIAERTFKTMLRTSPNKPQLHYLLGYLRNEQGRYADAKPEFAEAVRLDPDYLNAWKELEDLSSHVQMTPQEKDDAELAKLRLDPLGVHSNYNVSSVHDLARLYTAAQTAIAMRLPKPTTLYPFAAAAARLAKENNRSRTWYNDESDAATPGEMLSNVNRVSAVLNAMD